VVVFLDDDIVTHEIYKKKFNEYEKEIEVKYFTKCREAMEFIKSMEDKYKVLLLTKHEFKKRYKSGRSNKENKDAR
jgi:hypothetical protein